MLRLVRLPEPDTSTRTSSQLLHKDPVPQPHVYLSTRIRTGPPVHPGFRRSTSGRASCLQVGRVKTDTVGDWTLRTDCVDGRMSLGLVTRSDV